MLSYFGLLDVKDNFFTDIKLNFESHAMLDLILHLQISELFVRGQASGVLERMTIIVSVSWYANRDMLKLISEKTIFHSDNFTVFCIFSKKQSSIKFET